MDLHLDPERVAAHRLADSMWWGAPPARLEVATLSRRPCLSRWCVALLALAATIVVFHEC